MFELNTPQFAVILGLMAFGWILSYIFSVKVQKMKRREEEMVQKLEEKGQVRMIGHLILDQPDLEHGSGVYLQLEEDPKTITDEEVVTLGVWRINSQEKQGV